MNTHATSIPVQRPNAVDEQFDDAVQQRDAATIGMWIFLATEVMFFGVLFAAYTILRLLHPEGFAEGSRHTDLLLGSIETAVLLTSSITVMLGVRALKLGARRTASRLLLLTSALGCAFLVIHGFEYYSEYTEQLIPGINFHHPGAHAHGMELFYCLYYFITGFHTLHLLIAVVINTILGVRVARGVFDERRYTTLELSSLYWHLVDIVWLFVFPLLYLVGRVAA